MECRNYRTSNCIWACVLSWRH